MIQIALRAARFLTEQADRFQLVQQVSRGFIDVEHPVDRFPETVCFASISGARPIVSEIVGDGQGVDPRLKRRGINDRFDQIPST